MGGTHGLLKTLRSILINDSVIHSYIEDRVSTSHISLQSSPVYPTITFTALGGYSEPSIDTAQHIILGIDIWSKKTQDEVWSIYDRVKKLFHNYQFISNENNVGGKLFEVMSPVLLYEDEFRIHHLHCRYRCVTIDKIID